MFNIPSFFGFRAGGSSPLLDLYPGAAAAYSLRLLNSTYLGSAIQVRESTGNTTLDIGFVSGELDTAALLAHCAGANGFVTNWFDQSGNARNATQGLALRQAQIVNSGSIILENAKPSLDMLNLAGYTTFMSISQPFTFFGVITRSGVNASIVFDGVVGVNRSFVFISTTWLANSGSSITSANSDTNQILINSLHNTTSSELYINTVLEATGNIGTNSLGSMVIGTNSFLGTFFDGDFQELIFYPSDQSTNRTGIEDNINDFYSIYP